MSENINNYLVMVSGKSATGKSACLQGLTTDSKGNTLPKEEQAKVMYLVTEAGKLLPFKNSFTTFKIIDPLQVNEAFEHAMASPDKFNTIVVDSQTFLMEQYESQYVLGAKDTMKGWLNFQQFFKKLMQEYVPQVPQQVIFTAHTLDVLNESTMTLDTKIPVKGALKNVGIESYFSCVISTKRVPLNQLAPFKNDLLTITPREEIKGFKYVFQTDLTKETIGEYIRSPMGMWSHEETYIDNNIALVLQRLHEFYN